MPPVNEPAWLTWATRIGALLVGPLSLLISFRQHRRDRAQLRLDVRYREYWGQHYPPNISIAGTVTNVGRRPATIDKVFARAGSPAAGSMLDKIFVRARWEEVEFSYSDTRFAGGSEWPVTIPETKLFQFSIASDALRNGRKIFEAKQLLVRDTAGNEWKSVERFGQERVKELLSAEELRSMGFGPSKGSGFGTLGIRQASLKGFRALGHIFLELYSRSDDRSATIYIPVNGDFDAVWSAAQRAAEDYVANGVRTIDEIARELRLPTVSPSEFHLLGQA